MFTNLLRKAMNLSTHNQSPLKRAMLRPCVDVLEARAVPATLLVNDNWVVTVDTGPAGLSAGDTVKNSADVGATAVTGTFGTTAFATINDAVAAANARDTVRVLQGNYAETVTIDESLTLKGANAGISAGANAGVRGTESVLDGAITVQADNVTIDGLSIENGADIGGDVAGIFLAGGASNVTIKNSILTGAGTGRGILSTFNGDNDNLTILNNDIGNWTTGVFNQSNQNVDVVGNVIHDNVAGVANDFVEDVLIQSNDFENNDEAIGVFQSSDVVVKLNNLAGNDVAINNYGGPAVNASFNFFGTTDPDEIDDLVSGDVNVENPLGDEVTATTHIFSGNNGATLVVDTATGEYVLTLANGTTFEGTGVRVKKGKLMIHDHSSGGKVDVTGSINGAITVNLRGQHKMSFRLNEAA